MLKIKRVYDPPARGDGERILVDRIWPRGLSNSGPSDRCRVPDGPRETTRRITRCPP